jgi:uncharacterized repeat protein (TIGR02543 family)
LIGCPPPGNGPSTETFTVTYDASGATGGKVPTDNTVYTDGDTVTVIGNTGNLSKADFTFDGWSTSADGNGDSYSEGDTFIITSNTTLFARWSAVTYSVTYHPNEADSGSIPVDNTDYKEGDTVTVKSPTDLSRSGYNFVSWNEAANGTSNTHNPSETFVITGEVDLYAQWGLDYTALYSDTGAGLVGVNQSDSAFTDVDSDNDPDLLIIGYDDDGERHTRLYINDGNGNFVKDNQSSDGSTPVFYGVSVGSLSIGDVDGQNGSDIFITGFNLGKDETAYLYINDGDGTFTVDDQSSGETSAIFNGVDGIYSSASTFLDADGQNGLDLMVTGQDGSANYTATLYLNNGNGSFTKDVVQSWDGSGAVFDGSNDGSISVADVDGQNGQDILITGLDGSLNKYATLYVNDGSGSFTKEYWFTRVHLSSSSFADVDNDNDPDLVITGKDSTGESTTLYTNSGGSFSDSSQVFTNVDHSSSSFADIDDDGDQDFVITGDNGSERLAILYINDGSGNFTAANAGLNGVGSGSSSFADVDGDGDMDLLITGIDGSNNNVATLYTNGLY